MVPCQQAHQTSRPIELCAASRRFFMGSIVAAVPFFASSPPVMAKDELFKANPLTNGVLEQVSQWAVTVADQSVLKGNRKLNTKPSHRYLNHVDSNMGSVVG